MTKFISTAVLFLAYQVGAAVQLTISPSTQAEAKCPTIQETYTVQVAGGGSLPNCTYSWTITGGTIVGATTGSNISAKWDDETGKGTLTVTAGSCNPAEHNGSTVSAQYTRLSVFGREWPTPSAYLTSINVPLCDPPPYVDIGVDHLYVQNTGGIAEPPRVEVDVYAWSIPVGWKQDVTNIAGPAFVTCDIPKPASISVYREMKGLIDKYLVE